MSPPVDRKRVLLVPYPAFGHVIPFLEFGKRLTATHDVTLAVQADKVKQIRARSMVTDSDRITLVSVEDGYDEQKANELPFALRQKVGIETAVAGLMEFAPKIRSTSSNDSEDSEQLYADLVVVDNFIIAPIIIPTCVKQQIPVYHFNTAAAGLCRFMLAVREDYPVLKEGQSSPIFLQPGKPEELPPVPEYLVKCLLPVNKTMHLINGVIANTVYEVDEPVIDGIRSHPIMKDKPFYCIGPLIPPEKLDSDKLETERFVRQWLDARETESVIYVSFGTLTYLEEEQQMELAHALLEMKRPFIWSLSSRFHHNLPEILRNLGEQTVDSPYLILEWAPQKMILGHPSTSVFLSHCGWNSTLETLFNGVPVLCWPMFGDQLMNAVWLVEREVGILVEGTSIKSVNVTERDKIAELLGKLAGFNEEGKSTFRTAAKKWAATLKAATGPDGSSTKALQEVIQL